MPSPCEDETVTEMDVITNDARNLPDVDVATVASAVSVATINQLAVTEETSWFRRYLATGALSKVDGVWTRTVQVLTTKKAQIDSMCPIARTAYVYYDDEVYDAALTEASTGITYVTQLIFDSETKLYYVYYRWKEINFKLDGPHKTIESAKKAFQAIYQEKFDVEWIERESAASENWICEVRTYEASEEVEEVEELIEESDAEVIIAREKIVEEDTNITEETETIINKEEVNHEHEASGETVLTGEDNDTIITETAEVAEPVGYEKPSAHLNAEAAAFGAGGLLVGSGVVDIGIAANAASDTGHPVSCTNDKVDGVRTPRGWLHSRRHNGRSARLSSQRATKDTDIDIEYDDPFVLEKSKPLAGGKKGGSTGLSTSALAAIMSASQN
ncbi:hypothetical protein BGZ68_009454 [Mortierella alpina]|nr:hypothetical protein BGZ68_009454 [Mortierella alpina]